MGDIVRTCNRPVGNRQNCDVEKALFQRHIAAVIIISR